MTPQQADQLAAKINQSWPNSRIPTAVWAEDIADLDYTLTATSIVQLRRSLDRTPTIAEVRHHAKALTATNHPQGRPLPNAEDCTSFRHHLERRMGQAFMGNQDARDEVERWIDYAARSEGFAGSLIGPRMRAVIAECLDGCEEQFPSATRLAA